MSEGGVSQLRLPGHHANGLTVARHDRSFGLSWASELGWPVRMEISDYTPLQRASWPNSGVFQLLYDSIAPLLFLWVRARADKGR